MIWLLPLVPLSARSIAQVGVSALLVAVCWTTTQVFPIHYDDLLNLRPPGPGLLLTRNELLAALWVLLLFVPVRARESEAP
jgi:hypothetical protein